MITIYQGESLIIFVEVKDDAGALLDLTDATAKIAIYDRTNKPPVLLEDLTIVSPGLLSVELSQTDTIAPIGLYQAEVRIWFSSGLIRTVAENQITFVRSGFNVV